MARAVDCDGSAWHHWRLWANARVFGGDDLYCRPFINPIAGPAGSDVAGVGSRGSACLLGKPSRQEMAELDAGNSILLCLTLPYAGTANTTAPVRLLSYPLSPDLGAFRSQIEHDEGQVQPHPRP